MKDTLRTTLADIQALPEQLSWCEQLTCALLGKGLEASQEVSVLLEPHTSTAGLLLRALYQIGDHRLLLVNVAPVGGRVQLLFRKQP